MDVAVPRELHAKLLNYLSREIHAFENTRGTVEKVIIHPPKTRQKRKPDHLLRIIQDECRCLNCRPKLRFDVKTFWVRHGDRIYSTEVGRTIMLNSFCNDVYVKLKQLTGQVGFILPAPKAASKIESKVPPKIQQKSNKNNKIIEKP